LLAGWRRAAQAVRARATAGGVGEDGQVAGELVAGQVAGVAEGAVQRGVGAADQRLGLVGVLDISRGEVHRQLLDGHRYAGTSGGDGDGGQRVAKRDVAVWHPVVLGPLHIHGHQHLKGTETCDRRRSQRVS